jgi:hypothetical protein
VNELRALGETLRDLGPWGIVAILLYVLRDRDRLVQELQRARVEDADKRVEDEQARGAFARELLERTIGVLRDVVETARRGKQ